jgi:O-acetyl-ADP-ribose deacetylase (regulator of RNase III)
MVLLTNIYHKTGNIFEETTDALVNTVNCSGIMGKGIALEFKKIYPGNFRAYEKACHNNEVKLGTMFVFETNSLTNPKYIINFPTKKHWKSRSQIGDIIKGLDNLELIILRYQIKSISIPPLGCGLGGLNWAEVEPLIVGLAKKLESTIFHIYEPKEDESTNAGYSSI